MRGSDDDGDATTVRSPTPVPSTRIERATTQPADRATADLARDQQIGRYRLVARLGAGAMGVVWSALDPQLDRKVAIKVVHPNLARTPDVSTRLLREARAMAKLSHRNVITVHDAGELDGQLFLAMELVPGTTLGTILRARSADALADWPRWLLLMLDAGRGLAAAHRAGVLHRDFKPDNVLVDETGRVCVSDFGLATLGDETRAELTQRWSSAAGFQDAALDLTMTGALLGTPAYMSPQQLRGVAVDARADQFSFCVATWEALFGARPFQVTEQGFDAIPALAEMIDAARITDPSPTSPVPAAVRAVLRRGLAADPAARWPDMDTLIEALALAARQDVPVAPTRGTRKATLVTAIVALLVAMIVVVVVLIVGAARARERAATTPAAATAPVRAVVTAKPMFGIGVRTLMAISADGKRLALGGEALEVRRLGSQELWTTTLDAAADIIHIEVDDHTVRFGTKSGRQIHRWDYVAGSPISVEADVGGRWFGRSTRGDVVYADTVGLRVVDRGVTVLEREVGNHVEVISISPDKRRVAYVDASRFDGHLLVWDVETNRAIQSRILVAPTALAWLDDRTLLFATGTQQLPTLYRVTVAPTGFSDERAIYSLDTGWFGELLVSGKKVLATQIKIVTRARLLARNGSVRDLDASAIAAPLAWLSSTEFLAWNRTTGRIQRRTLQEQGTPTPYQLDGEPANATRADDLLIVTIRRPQGREAVAFGPDGAVRWRHDDLKTLAIRCAGDREPPCFALRAAKPDSIVTLDSRTGGLGTRPIFQGIAEDLAVSDDGERILVSRPTNFVTELDAKGAVVVEHEMPLPSTRSIAFDPQGGWLVGGTRIRSKYQVGRMFEGRFEVITETDNDVLSLVRPSPDGSQILVHLRVYAPEIYELTLP